MTSLCRSFTPVIGPRPRVLILGSMPGIASLDAVQYYAHPRNRFWPMMARMLRTELPSAYDECLSMLRENNIALWDVLAECERPGSLDTSIRIPSQQANAIPELLANEPTIQRVLCNGGHAHKVLLRFFPQLPAEVLALPSTSPANASWSLEKLLHVWSAALRPDPR